MASKTPLRAPPINEVGLSVATTSHGVLDPYDVRGLHEAFSDYPKAERQFSFSALNVAAMVGGGSNAPILGGLPPQKWWFITEDQSRVIQAQEDFFSYNWRRVGREMGVPVSYPGFARILHEFKKALEQLEDWHSSRGTELPDPTGCELYYEDVVSLRKHDDSFFSLSEALVELDRIEPKRQVAGWSNSWLESIDFADDLGASTMKVEISSLGMIENSDPNPVPILRITWTAGGARNTWTDVIKFFEVAHDHIGHRFNALISEEVKATWR